MRQREVCAGLVLLTTLTVGLAHAQSPGIPYSGRLERDGQAVNGSRNLSFTFYGQASGGTALGAAIERQVEVFDGSFATILTPVPGQAFDGRPLFLEVAVDGQVLAGRQQLLAVPFAMGTAQGDHFVVSGRLGIVATNPTRALVVGSGANGQGGTANTLTGVSTVEIPLGDESAGGLYLHDAQDSGAQYAELSYSSGDQKIRLHNKDRGLRVDSAGHVEMDGNGVVRGNAQVDGNLQVSGSLTSAAQGLGGCPADMEPIGFWCIDTAAKTGTWGQSVDDCDARHAVICPLSAILMCDEQNLGKGRGYACGDLTDADGAHPAAVRTGDSHAPVDTNGYDESAYTRISCFNYVGNDINTTDCQGDDVRRYFCCRPGMF